MLISLFKFHQKAVVFVIVGFALSTCLLSIGDAQEGRSIVVLRERVDFEPFIKEMQQRLGFRAERIYRQALRGFSASVSAQGIAFLKGREEVRYIVPDRSLHVMGQSLSTGADRIDADLNETAAINGDGATADVDIAIIDTGVDLDHPDIDVYRSVNFADGKDANDKNGHGTHVAGIVAARDNGEGVVGVSPGARIWAVRVLGTSGSGLLSDVIAGVDWVTEHAAEIEVANMSLGGEGADDGNCGRTNQDPLHEAICNSVAAGVTYVVAAGNENRDAAGMQPASYDEVITVSAIVDTDGKGGGIGPSTSYGADDSLASFSNFGEDIDFAAPGVSILSTYKDGGYSRKSGTSMAAPFVAGGAALVLANQPGLSSEGVKLELLSLAIAQGEAGSFTGDRDLFGEPLLNLSPLVVDDLAVARVVVPVSVVRGAFVDISVLVENEGRIGNSSYVTLLDETTGVLLGSQYVSLFAKTAQSLTLTWDTGGVALGNHVLKAEIAPLLAERDTLDNVKRATTSITESSGKRPKRSGL